MDSKYGSSAGVCTYLRRGRHDCPHLGHGRDCNVGRKIGLKAAGLGDLKMRRIYDWDFIVRVMSELLTFHPSCRH